MAEQQSSFTRGIFAGVVLDSLLFPYPRPLDERNADEARTVRRLIKSLREMQGTLIDSAKFDEEETIAEDVIRAFAEIGMLGLTIPKKYGGLELSSSAYIVGSAPRRSCCTATTNRKSGTCRRWRGVISWQRTH